MAKTTTKQPTQYLYLDSVSSRDLILVLLGAEGRALARRLVKNGSRTELLLPSLVKFVGRKKVAGLAVAQGSGSFTQARLVCAIVNALAYGWGVPAVSVRLGTTRLAMARRLLKAKPNSLAQPLYYGPAV